MFLFSIGKSLYFYKAGSFVYQEKLSSRSLGPSEVFQAAYLDTASQDGTYNKKHACFMLRTNTMQK